MKITAPHGYGEIVPLQKHHRVRLPETSAPEFCRSLGAIALSLSEIAPAARDYPVVFLTLDGGRSFAPAAVVGLGEGANLFVDAAGEWERGAYVPAFVRRYPFCLSRLRVDGAPRAERVVCVARERLDDAGTPLFDGEARPTPQWQAAQALLAEYEADLERTARWCAALGRLRLLEPFTAQTAGERPALRLAGMHRASEAKLRDLKAASLKMLATRGWLGPAYLQLHSLANFSRLIERAGDLTRPRAGAGRA